MLSTSGIEASARSASTLKNPPIMQEGEVSRSRISTWPSGPSSTASTRPISSSPIGVP